MQPGKSYTQLALFFILCLLLTACGHEKNLYRHDSSAPRRGQKPYTINGELYQPLSSHEGFVQGGTASWYGDDFHGRETSSGETYDMYAMTAAHKTLPLGVYVQVNNRENGRMTVVRINDRGPFVKGRIIDLSYSAARELGLLENGTAAVRIEALGYLDSDSKGNAAYRAPASYDRGSFGIQVGAFGKMENARKMAGEMKQRYGFSTIREAFVNGTRYYRVRAGNYASLKEAEKVREHASDRVIVAGFVVALD